MGSGAPAPFEQEVQMIVSGILMVLLGIARRPFHQIRLGKEADRLLLCCGVVWCGRHGETCLQSSIASLGDERVCGLCFRHQPDGRCMRYEYSLPPLGIPPDDLND